MCSDATLVAGVKTGDKKALGRLVERYKRPAYSLALGIVGNKDDAFDISQEAFLRVYRSAKTFDESRPFLPWFYTIITNLSRTWLRKRRRHEGSTVDLDDISFLLIDESNPEAAMEKRESIVRLRESLMRLSFEDREIITLQHFRGMSYEEIAELLGIPRGTVMSRLYYARKKLAKLMRDENNG